MVVASATTLPVRNKTHYEDRFDPLQVLNHPDFKVLDEEDIKGLKEGDDQYNLACAYNEKHEVHLIRKPESQPGPGEVKIRVRATGICG
jgi:L-iditol 2-dehydrogenase